MIKELSIELLPHYQELPLPKYAKEGDSGFDLRAANVHPTLLMPGERGTIPTGLKFGIPEGFEVQVRSRSGLASKEGLTVLNSPGTVDCGYRGEVSVVLYNAGDKPFVVTRGDRIAQAVMAPVAQAIIYFVQLDNVTERGEDGFGSTGLA